MNNLLANYMSKRVLETKTERVMNEPGPVLTVSRAAGCAVKGILCELVKQINESKITHRWDIVSRDILNISAQKLKMNPEQLKNVFTIEDRNLMDNMIKAFVSNEYKLETKVRKTTIKVIHQLGVEGHKIIIGRGGGMICSDVENSLHVRIDASMDWKVARVMQAKSKNKEQAIQYIEEIEKKRSNFRRSVNNCRKTDCLNFDLVISLDRMKKQQVAELIYAAMKSRGLLSR